ncbi:esterase/lipase family protein [Chloroflexota bacterium]
MFNSILKYVTLPIVIGLCTQLLSPGTALSAPAEDMQVKELNIVFLHGAGGNICSFQLIEDYLYEHIMEYSTVYERANPGTRIQINTLKRCYPGYMDIETWAGNIVESIDEYFPGKDDIILIGHSMGGKTALYAVANNTGGLAERVAMVVTINSPVKGLNRYFVTGGGSVYDYLQALWHLLDQGISTSVAFHDSSEDGNWVSTNKHWLAFISGESAPLSKQFDISGVDPWPRDMDDGLVPLSAQYAEGADVIYYGDYGHSDFSKTEEVAGFIGERILRYIFGDYIEFSSFSRGGTFTHKADWLLGTDHWEDTVGGIPTSSDTIVHVNESWFKWQEWEDIVGECPAGSKRDNYYVGRASAPFFSGIQEARWLSSDNVDDCRIYVKTRAAPRSTVQVNWNIHKQGLLMPGNKRDYYEVKIVSGTPLTSIKGISWETDNPLDLRMRISSEAQSPFRWFKAEWRVYSKEIRKRKIIDEMFRETVQEFIEGS